MRNKKYVVEVRVRKRKIWMGRYESLRDAQRACDVARFYTKKAGEFYFEDTPALLDQIRPPMRGFGLVSKEIGDPGYIKDLKSIAEEVIRKDFQNNYRKNVRIDLPPPDTMSICYSKLASASGETLIQVNYFRLAIVN